MSLLIRISCVVSCLITLTQAMESNTQDSSDTDTSQVNSNFLLPNIKQDSFYYDSKNARLTPNIPKDSNTQTLPKEKLSDEEKANMEKGLKTGVQKRDTDHSKLFELLGQHIQHYDNYMVVRGNAILKNKEAYIIADEITYNPDIKQVRLKGNVKIYKGNTLSISTKQATIYLNINYSIIRPFYIQDTQTGIWTSAESASQQKTTYRFKDSMVSGCSYISPAWRINSSRGYYDQEKNTLALWNPRIYIGDIPVFYFPYLKFSLENNRTSGFLYPTLGSSGTDGFTYIQPYYIAPQSFWDMTISPQVRTSRGGGVNFEFRAIDSSNDKYLLHLKYFYNSNDYVARLNLLNQHIYGFDFKHSKRDVIQKYFGAKTDLDNGMYFDLAFMNDIDYMRLDDVRYFLNATSYISKINLYTQTKNDYFGFNLRYYLNLYNPNNKTTLHNLPNLQYHRYLGNLFLKELLYSFNYQMKHASRSQGYSYLSNEISLPIGMQFSFLNKYFSIGAWLNAYAGNIFAINTDNTQIYQNSQNPTIPSTMTDKIGNYANLNYRVSINTDIGRKYNKFFHSMQASAVFNAPIKNAIYTDGNLNPIVLTNFSNLNAAIINSIQNGANIWDPSQFSNIYQSLTRLDLTFSNYIYSNKGKELFYWRLLQTFNFSDTQSPFKIPMENKIGTSPIDGMYLSASFYYSWFYNNFTEFGISASYVRDSYAASISYYLKRDDTSWSLDPISLLYKSVDATNYLSASVRGDLGYFGIVADIAYDFSSNNIINLGIGIYKDIKCFGIGIKAGSNRTPILSQSNTISVIDNIYVKAEFKFVPLTTFGYTYRLRPSIEEKTP